MTRHATAALLTAACLLAAGCSSTPKKDAPQENPAADALTAARAYQQAANAQNWKRACELSTAALRGGTVAQCTASHLGPTPTPTPSETVTLTPSPTDSPPTYADGSTPEPLPTHPPATGPDRATIGPVTAGGTVQVAATRVHPAGYGVLITYTVQWPGKPATTARRALRVVDEGGAWHVDQHEDVQDGDSGHGSPVAAALSGG
ncbi:hypothetical protein QMK19_33985 [Streptomyces sp. H10-C2]|uniref:hypothetical protein n=1 Tax=unclassified Streptomyces TaxID=2593676 RepID=UPI0024BA9757|nr:MULTISPECIES: hypothetical protein [unclassified Streptomyces]MDJ0345559.1 hypothetical protein [Streptomyces sp. PH10-H1]MDJ0374505.1 hypothetical protein [Streptomyces sp. H10-C2]